MLCCRKIEIPNPKLILITGSQFSENFCSQADTRIKEHIQNLATFEGLSIRLQEIRQGAEPLAFWRFFSNKTLKIPDSKKSLQNKEIPENNLQIPKNQFKNRTQAKYQTPTPFEDTLNNRNSRPSESTRNLKAFWKIFSKTDFYQIIPEWDPWFAFKTEQWTALSRSSRSKKSVFVYAEAEQRRHKSVFFLYPMYNDPFYGFDLDDLKTSSYGLLLDPKKRVVY